MLTRASLNLTVDALEDQRPDSGHMGDCEGKPEGSRLGHKTHQDFTHSYCKHVYLLESCLFTYFFHKNEIL